MREFTIYALDHDEQVRVSRSVELQDGAAARALARDLLAEHAKVEVWEGPVLMLRAEQASAA
ncbi:hypothetical protein [Phenylobacterium sp.]|uniref:hypothetical protein n=1 Tax=Phenylobacterium sp. TaxID=1871053 RepID=UPI002FE34688